uniref:Ribosomal protein L7Ae/L30e/S12e/Gadd45 n=1 Tax=Tanacetum cinerariifolium TaxID=118510 RepID=A0A6L2LAC4_TANCI|nr:ribosomal protein L7Ae/L30e/S12e/Gadd45 [Tanacetum cinerariifolium]
MPNQVLTKEVREDLKRWEELIRENLFSLGGHQDHLSVCFSYMLYCILAEQQYNLACFFVRRIESAKATPKAHLPYGMFLTRLFDTSWNITLILTTTFIMSCPLTLRQSRKPQSDRGVQKARHSISSSSTHHFGSSSHKEDDDNDEGTS